MNLKCWVLNMRKRANKVKLPVINIKRHKKHIAAKQHLREIEDKLAERGGLYTQTMRKKIDANEIRKD